MDPTFDNAKAAALRRLARDRAAGLADPLAAPAVDALNARPGWYTTSSCSGRVQLLALPRPGAKAASRVLGRWHQAPDAAALRSALGARPPERAVYLFVQPPILHVAARGLPEARTLLGLGPAAGFKASHVRSMAASGRLTVEFGGTERIEAPVALPGASPAHALLDLAAATAPALLDRGHAHLGRLVHHLDPAGASRPPVQATEETR